MHATPRDPSLFEILPRVVDFCDHEPDPKVDGLAVCDHCANKIIVIAGISEEPEERLH